MFTMTSANDTVLHLKFTKRIDLKCFYHKNKKVKGKKVVIERTDSLINLIMVIISYYL